MAGANEDAPIPFDVTKMPDHLDFLATSVGGQVAQFVGWLTMRIRMMLADRRLGPIVVPETQVPFAQWLEEYIGTDRASNVQITILDLTLLPYDVLYIVIPIIPRVT